jgi:predicted ATPase
MSTIGRELRIPAEGERHVFSNNDDLFNGMRIAIQQGVLDHNNVVVYFKHIVDGVEQTTSIPFNKDGLADYWPIGFFDQIENDLITMLDWKPIV